jgi:predicted GH43/DUF377 family glycosyl hydrolase
MTEPRALDLAIRTAVRLRPDPSRVVTQLFVAGLEHVGGGESRASEVVHRVLQLDEAEVGACVDDLQERFSSRHPELVETYVRHADRVADRLDPDLVLTVERRYLLGAMFTNEVSVESAALCNPSIVPHPDQSGCAPGELRFVMSVRGIGEGHRSSIGFRTGVISRDRAIVMDPTALGVQLGTPVEPTLDRAIFYRTVREEGDDADSAAFVLDPLGDRFTSRSLEVRLAALLAHGDTRRDVESTVAHLRGIADRTYASVFDAGTALSQRVLWPHGVAEANGMEDARFVRFDDGDRHVYYGTYTAFDGVHVHQHLIETDDFLSFRMSPMAGMAAQNKGLALFPRRIGARYHALSRADRATNAIAVSEHLSCWDDVNVIQTPARSWEAIQVGNCGSPMETPEGWLVLTHGVGAMRTYSIGAMLLDLDDPTKVIASLDDPLLRPSDEERDGYVPNVLYSCGGLIHEGVLVLPYGVADQSISIATVECDELLRAMT